MKTSQIANLHLITNAENTTAICQQVVEFCAAGGRWVQLRMKQHPLKTILKTGQIVQQVCQDFEAHLIINDHIFVAQHLKADGVHLGQTDCSPTQARAILGPAAIIGYTVNTLEDILSAPISAVNYFGLGPFKPTSTKTNLAPILGLSGYHKILQNPKIQALRTPFIAIGGISPSDIATLRATGIHGVAVSSAITNSPTPIQTTQTFIQHLNSTSTCPFYK